MSFKDTYTNMQYIRIVVINYGLQQFEFAF